MFGVDEAGRGPVLGSMFIGCACGPQDAIPEDVADSKELSYEIVHELANQIQDREQLSTTVIEVPVDLIDKSESMTAISANAYAEAISSCAEDGDEGIIDAFTRNIEKAENSVQEHTSCDVQIIAEFSADESYPHVSAASILAKSAREDHVNELESSFGNVGSGYPSDGTTQQFLEDYVCKHGELPSCARASWSTSENIVEEFS